MAKFSSSYILEKFRKLEGFKTVNLEHFNGINLYKLEDKVRDPNYGSLFSIRAYNFFAETVFSKRVVGSSSSGHYHLGMDETKNPEDIFIPCGKLLLIALNPEGQRLEMTINEGTRILIKPRIWHQNFAEENSVIYEPRPKPFNPKNDDTYRIECWEYARKVSDGEIRHNKYLSII